MRLQLPAAVNMIIDVLQAHGYEGFAVGGCVRDSVLNRTQDDWDITTSATPYQVKELFGLAVVAYIGLIIYLILHSLKVKKEEV